MLILIYISPLASDVKHLFMSLSFVYHLWWNVFLSSFYFLLFFFLSSFPNLTSWFFLQLSFGSSLYILNLFIIFMVCKYFLPVWNLSFYPFNKTKYLTLMKSNLLIFLNSCIMPFILCLRIPHKSHVPRTFSYVFL